MVDTWSSLTRDTPVSARCGFELMGDELVSNPNSRRRKELLTTVD
jgi:hypothetical protein